MGKANKINQFQGAKGIVCKWTIIRPYSSRQHDSVDRYDHDYYSPPIFAETRDEAMQLFNENFEEFKKSEIEKGKRIIPTGMPEVTNYEIHMDVR